jgi:hypothetical protein
MSEEGRGGSRRREERLGGAHGSGGKAWPYGVDLDGGRREEKKKVRKKKRRGEEGHALRRGSHKDSIQLQ